MSRKPYFYDITLRDANQSLKKPWNLEEKALVFDSLLNLNIPAIEVGFPGSSQLDFEASRYLAEIAPDNIVIAGLARAVHSDIIKAVDAISCCKNPRVHTFITMSPFNMKYVLNKSAQEVRSIAIEAVKFAKSTLNGRGDVEFSVEHFGDCMENLDFVIETLKDIVNAGATVINLPNTVERTRLRTFLDMVERVYEALPKDIIISVHCHNDLGMATATTVESYFSGATQLECSLNGLGERAGNTNFYEVAVALHNSGVDVPLEFSKFYETALLIAEMSKVEIYEKAPLIGPEALAHRSGIHQDGAVKTKDMEKGAYRAINPALIGRKNDEKLGFTSQSGKTAVYEIITQSGFPITLQEAARITPYIKSLAEKIGELSTEEIMEVYFDKIYDIKGAFVLEDFDKISNEELILKFKYNDAAYEVKGKGNGPLDACLDALKNAGFEQKLNHYEQAALDEELFGSGAVAMSIIHFEGKNGEVVVSRARDKSTLKANLKAIFNGLNIIYSS